MKSTFKSRNHICMKGDIIMNNTALKVGYWAAVNAVVAFVAYVVCFMAILFTKPIFVWTNFDDFIRIAQTSNQNFKHIAMVLMIVYGACYVIQLCSIEEIAEPSKKYYAKIAELFGTGFFVLIGINYFIQISAVRMQIKAGQTNGLEQFIQANPISAISAVNMLGWTVFFGLSCIFLALAFGSNKIEKIIKYAFFANGLMMLIGAIAYIFNVTILLFLCMYPGMGAAVITATIPLCKMFKDLQH